MRPATYCRTTCRLRRFTARSTPPTRRSSPWRSLRPACRCRRCTTSLIPALPRNSRRFPGVGMHRARRWPATGRAVQVSRRLAQRGLSVAEVRAAIASASSRTSRRRAVSMARSGPS
jgi:hypothetical protein